MALIFALQSDEQLERRIEKFKEILAVDNSLFQIIHKNALYISAHSSGSRSIDHLYSMNIGRNTKWFDELSLRSLGETSEIRIHDNKEIREYDVDGKVFALVIADGYVAGSFSPPLVEEFARNISTPNKSKEYLEDANASSFKVYIDLDHLKKANRLIFNDQLWNKGGLVYGNLLCEDSRFWLDGTYKAESKTTKAFLDSDHFDPMSFESTFPSNTAHFRINSVSSFSDFAKLITAEEKSAAVVDIEKLAELDSLFYNHFAKLILNPTSERIKKHQYLLFRSKNTADKKINFLSDSGIEIFSKGKQFPVYSVNDSQSIVFRTLAGEREFDYKNAVVINNDLIFAKNKDALAAYIDAWSLGRLNLSSTMSALNVTDQLWAEFSYTSISRSQNILKALFKPAILNRLISKHKQNDGPAHVITGIYRQGETLKLQVYSGGLEHELSGLSPVHAVALNDLVQTKPQCIYDGSDLHYFVQDESNTLFCVDNEGEVVFRTNAENKILSQIHEVDYFGNGESQYLFNTATSLFLIDNKGSNVGSYPIRLPDTTYAGLSFVQHSSIRDVKILVPCANRIYSYDLNGRRSSDFKFTANSGLISGQVNFIHSDRSNYILFKDVQGVAYVLDLRGNIIGQSDEFSFSPRNVFYADKGSDKVQFISTDVNGNILRMGVSGKISSVSNNVFGANHIFKAVDLDDDNINEYLFVDGNELSVYTSDMFLLLLKQFDHKLDPWVDIFEIGDGEVRIACSSTIAGENYLLDLEGALYEGFPVQGQHGFDINLSIEENNSVLVAGAGRYLKVYLIN
ncbi:MAG: hypothetical protein HKN22_04595 [Bacteroidia bacterium]|nr:hypothetical protein [Bacteroidia bacterium]